MLGAFPAFRCSIAQGKKQNYRVLGASFGRSKTLSFVNFYPSLWLPLLSGAQGLLAQKNLSLPKKKKPKKSLELLTHSETKTLIISNL